MLNFGIDEAIAFINKLHGVPEVFDKNYKIDWNVAPARFSYVGNKKRIDLPLLGDFYKKNNAFHKYSVIEQLSFFLWASCGCSKIRISPNQFIFPNNLTEAKEAKIFGFFPRRVIASGGASYPAEIYITFEGEWDNILHEASAYIFRYSPNFHSLIAHKKITRFNKNTTDEYENNQYRLNIFLCVNFHRTSFKYKSFAYRLSAVDLGCVLGRINRLAGRLFFNTTFDFDFLGKKLDRKLGLNSSVEATYAIIRSSILKKKIVKVK
jgi:SagB-type dehydrogenase family enzyme